MSPEFIWIAIFVVVALVFDFLNGFHDSANIVATMISSRALSPARALAIAAVCEFLGPFLFGVAVATTIGHEVIADEFLNSPLIFAALLSAITWNIATWYFGIPSSSSHALIGGLAGSALMANFLVMLKSGALESGDDLYRIVSVIHAGGIIKVLTALFISPLLGFVTGFVVIKIIYFLTRLASPKINWWFKKGQLLTSIALALSHGTNDAQKTMGVIAMALFAGGFTSEFKVPIWVMAACATSISIGTATGGWRLIKTIGGKFYKIRPIHGFTTQISSGALILGASLLGGPVSTTHVVSSAVLGAGSAERLSKVRWGVGKQIVVAWVITIPVTALLAALIYLIMWSTPWVG
ncbi:MAG: inorganic phosphate transporter [Deltaproteobacteria bacterium]|nr:inorganic phosphate transporter [Deltaproteobacteria bacterium]